MLTMRELRNRTKIMKAQKAGWMRNARSTCELAVRLWRAGEGCRRQMKSQEVQSTAEVRRMMQVLKPVRDREGWGGCAAPMKVQERPKTQDASDPT